jgi:tetratricopeptide (TPR) repeat protein
VTVFGISWIQRAVGWRRYTILVAWCLATVAAIARADDAPLFEQEPYDTIRLDEANRSVEIKVRPLDLPDRRLPAKPNPSDELEIRLLDRPRKSYKLAWESIVEVKLFEQRVLDEAERLVETKKLDEAYHYYDFLARRYPKMPALGPSYNSFLMAGAKESFKQEKFDECLALTWELFARDPEFPGAASAILRASEKLIDRRFADENFAAARMLVQEATDRLKDRAAPLATTWNEKLHAKAVALVNEAKQQIPSKHYAEASRAIRQALAAWPEVEGGKELVATIQAKYPQVVVGVTSLSAPPGSWEARRDGRLLTRSIVEVARIGADGNVYSFPLAKLSRADNDRRVELSVNPQIRWSDGRRPLTCADLARALLAQGDAAHPLYRPQWRELVAGVAIEDGGQVRIDLKQPMAHFEPWLETPVWPEYASPGNGAASLSLGPYRIETADAKEIWFTAVERNFAAGPKQLKQIVERLYPDSASALRALRRGEITAIDRIDPWDAPAVSNSGQIVVEPYGAASLHLLVPNLRRPQMTNATFRRALAHAINRSGILVDQLSRGRLPAGCEVVDGLFNQTAPSGAGGTAELRYDAGTAKLLARFARGAPIAGATASGESSALSTAELVLAYPPDETTRLACRAIAQQARAVGIPLGLKEITIADLAGGAIEADLIYVPWTPLEPLAELPRLIGRQGLGGDAGPSIERLFREALTASAAQASDRLGRLDQAIRAETLIIPLWRLSNFSAYDRSLTGVGKRPVTLYQNVEQWQLSAPKGSE